MEEIDGERQFFIPDASRVGAGGFPLAPHRYPRDTVHIADAPNNDGPPKGLRPKKRASRSEKGKRVRRLAQYRKRDQLRAKELIDSVKGNSKDLVARLTKDTFCALPDKRITHDRDGIERLLLFHVPMKLVFEFRRICENAKMYGNNIHPRFSSPITHAKGMKHCVYASHKLEGVREKMKRIWGPGQNDCMINALGSTIERVLSGALQEMGFAVPPDGIADWWMSVLSSEYNDVQPPHCDYHWHTVDRVRHKSRRDDGRRKTATDGTPFSCVAPYSLLFPLSREGLKLEVWPETSLGCTRMGEGDPPVVGKMLFIEYGQAVLFRGDVVHAGGYQIKSGRPCPRLHLYVYLEGGVSHDTGLSARYTGPDECGRRPIEETHHHGHDPSPSARGGPLR